MSAELATNQSQRGQAGFTWLELLAVLVMLVLIAGVAAHQLASMRGRGPSRGPSCQNNLKQFGLVMKMYSGESKGELYPPLASYISGDTNGRPIPRFAAPDVPSVYPEYLTYTSISECPKDPDLSQSTVDNFPEPDAFHALPESARKAGDTASLEYYQTAELARSYVYLGYAVKVVPEFYGWLGGTALLPTTGRVQVEGVGEVAVKDFSVDLTVEPGDWPAWVPLPDREETLKALDSPHEETSLPKVYRFREGIEGMFTEDNLAPASSARMQGMLPVMWDAYGSRTLGGPVDRFNHEPAGSNVLYMDGHVSFVQYPGEFPVVADRVMTDYFGRQGQG